MASHVAIPFSRSVRALRADGRSRRAIWFLAIPVVVLAAWTVWLFEARIARYETSDRAEVVSSGANAYVEAEFPAAAIARIHLGQRARVELGDATFAGGVAGVDRLRVKVALDRTPSAPRDGLPVRVEIAVETVSPATLLLRSAGLP